jgi:hypothetical protein
MPGVWERLLGAADALAQATSGAAFGREHLPTERVADLREQLAPEGDRGAAYRQGVRCRSASGCPGPYPAP